MIYADSNDWINVQKKIMFQKKKEEELRRGSVAKAILHSIVGGSKDPKSKDSKSKRYCAVSIITNDTNSYKPL